jgi:hypothetical protein
MPDDLQVEPTPFPTVTETVTESVFPTPPPPPEASEPAPPPTAVLGEDTDKALRDLIDGMNGVSAQLEGTESVAGPLVLDADQFTALGFGLVLVVALLAALLVVTMRR